MSRTASKTCDLMAGLSLPLLIYTHIGPMSIQNNRGPGQKAENRTKQSRARQEADTNFDYPSPTNCAGADG